jgi:cbb3-type cytochrome oxidase maturation protein
MDILIVTLFVSLLLGVGGLVLFILRLGAGDFEHADRLSLLPLEQDEPEDSSDELPTRALSDSGS